MTGLPLNPLASIIERRIESACETLAADMTARGEALRERMVVLKTERDRSGHWDIEAVLRVMGGMVDAGKDMADGMLAACWPLVASMVPPHIRVTVRERMRQAVHVKAAAAVAEWFGGMSPESIRQTLADAAEQDNETAAQTDALLADIFKETPTCH